MINSARFRLATGPGTATYVAFWIVFLLVPLPLVVIWVVVGGFFVVIFALVELPVFALIVLIGVRYFHMACWLEGTVLIQRRIWGMRRCDLSTALVTAESVSSWLLGSTTPLPRLVVRAPWSGHITLWLRNPARRQARLPADQLMTLARAIEWGRECDPWIRLVTDGLRRMAHDPLGVGGTGPFA